MATDHAPHTVEDKECEWAYARPGMVGLETALSIVVEAMAGTDHLWDRIDEWMSDMPARIAGLSQHGQGIRPGAPAHLTLFDPSVKWTPGPSELVSRSHNTPYAGRELSGRVVATFLRGEPTVLDGKAQK